MVSNTPRKLKLDTTILNQIQIINQKSYLILESTKCERCEKKFFKQISYDGSIQDYKLCPFCHSAYWNLPRMRKPYEKKKMIPMVKAGKGGKK